MRFAVLILTVALAPFAASAQHSEHSQHTQHMAAIAGPSEPGQSAFAAIQEVATILNADPSTDWDRVNIDALRAHLVDMDNVTLRADVTSRDVPGGASFAVTSGDDAVRRSIARMTIAHAAVMSGVDGWSYQTEATENGILLTVTGPDNDATRIRGLGFFGIMASGMHHQDHHLAIARGGSPHDH